MTFDVDVLALGAHPDDTEFGCGGILAKLAKQGRSVLIVDMTSGDKGSNGTPEIRREEGRAAAVMIGAQRIFLDFKDCELIDSYDGRLALVKVIRQYRPRLILAPYWKGEGQHPDHLVCGTMARYAVRYARFAKILPEIPIHRAEGILHYIFPCHNDFDFIIDVSDEVETWTEMMGKHASQLKTNDYIDWNLRHARRFGMLIGTEYAQALAKGNPIEIDDVMTIARGSPEV